MLSTTEDPARASSTETVLLPLLSPAKQGAACKIHWTGAACKIHWTVVTGYPWECGALCRNLAST